MGGDFSMFRRTVLKEKRKEKEKKGKKRKEEKERKEEREGRRWEECTLQCILSLTPALCYGAVRCASGFLCAVLCRDVSGVVSRAGASEHWAAPMGVV